MKIIINKEKDIIYYDKLIKYVELNDKNRILNKINTIADYKEAIKYNVNCNLLVDSLILSIGG